MKFRTELNPDPLPFQIDHQSQLLSIGSCFADMIGERLQKYKFKINANPFGNIYNPIVLHSLFDSTTDFGLHCVENKGVWHHHNLHSEVAATSKNKLLALIGEKKKAFDAVVQNADVIVITYGTAWVYELISEGNIVANCHKQPANLFNKRLLTIDEIEQSFKKMAQKLPVKTHIILTVSPIRHIKDTISFNAVSKALLRVATHQLVQTVKNVHYFPAYELMLDDLRDYRFYKKDLLHPNEMAEDYIWEKFAKMALHENTLLLIKAIDDISAATQHKPFQPQSEQHQQFIASQIKKIESLGDQFNFDNELAIFKNHLYLGNH